MISRRSFLKRSMAGATALVSISILNCYDSEDGGDNITPTNVNPNAPALATNINKHTHLFSEIDLNGGAQVISLSGGHDHSASLSADHIATLSKPGGTVTVTATGGQHSHSATFANLT